MNRSIIVDPPRLSNRPSIPHPHPLPHHPAPSSNMNKNQSNDNDIKIERPDPYTVSPNRPSITASSTQSPSRSSSSSASMCGSMTGGGGGGVPNYMQSRSNNPSGGSKQYTPQYENRSFSSGATMSNDSIPCQPIHTLNMYSNRWAIKVRVIQKSGVKDYNNGKNEGVLQSIDVVDEHGTKCRITMFNNEVNTFGPLFNVNECYIISKGKLKLANPRYSSYNHQFDISLSNDSIVTPLGDDPSIKPLAYHFVPIENILAVPPAELVDVIGVIALVDDESEVTTKSTHKQTRKRVITIMDESRSEGCSIEATLWGDAVDLITSTNTNQIIAIRGAKVSDFAGRSLSVPNSSSFELNPKLPEADRLKRWMTQKQAKASNEQPSTVSIHNRSDRMASLDAPYCTANDLNMLRARGLPDDQTIVRSIIGYLSFIRCSAEKPPVYPACPNDPCKFKKLIGDENSGYQCDRCNQTGIIPVWRYHFTARIVDSSDSIWMDFFGEEAKKVMQMSAEDMAILIQRSSEQFGDYMKELIINQMPSYVFKVRIANTSDAYQKTPETPKVRITVAYIQPPNFAQEANRLMNTIPH